MNDYKFTSSLLILILVLFNITSCGGSSSKNTKNLSNTLDLESKSVYVNFESGHVRPLALSHDGNTLFAVNTPSNTIEIFDITDSGLKHAFTVPVGMEPVAVAVKSDSEVWVVNHLSDSISIVDLSSPTPGVIKTLLVGDEPRDIVFAGSSTKKAFITTAHRGQHSPYSSISMPENPGEAATPGIGRADVWVFSAENTGNVLGGKPETIISLFTDMPRALAVSKDKSTVYAAGFFTGNQTTTIPEGTICNGGGSAEPCIIYDGSVSPGGLPYPNVDRDGIQQNEVGLIVKFNQSTGKWEDELKRDWSKQVMFNLPDKDVFAIDANTTPAKEKTHFSGVGTVVFNMVVNPQNQKVYVSNTKAINEVRFEGRRGLTDFSSTIGHAHETHISIIDGNSVVTRHLNSHINYNEVPSPSGTKEKSLATPTDMVVSKDGKRLYLAAFGSSKVAIIDTTELESEDFESKNTVKQIEVSGGGPSGLILEERRGRLYVMNRFDNSLSIINTNTQKETDILKMFTPEPEDITEGRRFLYDANFSSSNGEASCASCHVFGDFDGLAWDLGDPEGSVLSNPNKNGPVPGNLPYHPLKGPMTTQSLRGLSNQGPLHWRGDRTAAHEEDGDSQDTFGAFKRFNIAFVGLLGRESIPTDEEMNSFTEFAMTITYPPNPNRKLDNSLTSMQAAGKDIYSNVLTTQGSLIRSLDTGGFLKCIDCHQINREKGLFGSSGLVSSANITQVFKIAHHRNLYQKVGMFGMSPVGEGIFAGERQHMGDQIKGFGFAHNGSVDTIPRFHSAAVFRNIEQRQHRELEQFLLGMETNMMPIIGQQVTLSAHNRNQVSERIQLFFKRMDAGECEVIVKGINQGKPFGGIRLPSGNFQLDDINKSPVLEKTLLDLANVAGQELTFTAVPNGSGRRLGVDSDDDGILNSNE